jgi:hypothetical protein
MSFVENKKHTAYQDRIGLALSDVQREREFFKQPLPDNEYLRAHCQKRDDSERATFAYSRADFAAFQRARDAAEKARESIRNYPNYTEYDFSKIKGRRLFGEAVFAAKMVIGDCVVAINAELDVLRRSAATAEVHSIFASARAEDHRVEWSIRLAEEAAAKAKSVAKEADDYAEAHLKKADLAFKLAEALSRATKEATVVEYRYAIMLAEVTTVAEGGVTTPVEDEESSVAEGEITTLVEDKEPTVAEMAEWATKNAWTRAFDLRIATHAAAIDLFLIYNSRVDIEVKKPVRRFEQ